jgi:TetR/AcrR family transcriptional regulator
MDSAAPRWTRSPPRRAVEAQRALLFRQQGGDPPDPAEDLLDIWIDPLARLDPAGDPIEEILAYVRRKVQMSRDFPRESRLFANEILQGAPRIEGFMRGELKQLVDEKAELIATGQRAGRIADVDPYHLIFSIWALTQHYADFDAQIRGRRVDPLDGLEPYLERLFSRLLAP